MEAPVQALVVEDDGEINGLLCGILRGSGYEAQPAFSGTEALLYLDKQEWSLVLLDLMLPGLRGEEVLARIRERGDCPVVVISAEGAQRAKVAALRTGADDYITKPFDIEEVSARIDALLRRLHRLPAREAPKLLRHKDLTMDVVAKTVTVRGEELTLTAREYDILALMLANPKKLFAKANLFESVWGEPFLGGEENTINVHMSNLRGKLAKANPDEEYLETIWGMGYRLKS